MKPLKLLLIFGSMLAFCGCNDSGNYQKSHSSEQNQPNAQLLLTRAEFAPMKENLIFCSFPTEVVELAPEGSLIASGSEIAQLSPGDLGDQLELESANLEVLNKKVELEKVRLKIAQEIELQKLELARIDLEKNRVEYERARDFRDWQRILELEESFKLEKIKINLLNRQVQASQKMVSRGFVSEQDLLQNRKDLVISQINASLTQRLIPFLEGNSDEKKLKQAFEAYEKSRLAYEVASHSMARNIADYRYNLGEETRRYETSAFIVNGGREKTAELSISAPARGLLLYGSTYSGSELIKVSLGSQVYPGIPLLRIVDPKDFGISFEIFPKESQLTSIGQKIFFRPDSFPENVIPCSIQSIAPVALEIRGGRPDGRTMLNLKASVDVEQENLKLGYSGTVFSAPALEYWKKAFRGKRTHRVDLRKMFRKTSAMGDVKPASFSYIVSMSDSKLNFIEEEGKTVEKGAVISKVDNTDGAQNLSDNEIELRKLKEELQLLVEKNKLDEEQLARQLEVKQGALEVARLKHLALLKGRDEDAIIDLQRSLELTDAKIDLAKEKVAHIKELNKKGLRSEIELMQAETEVAALLKDRAINLYKLELENSGPSRRSVAISELEVKKAEAELEKVKKEVMLGQTTNSMNIRIKELEVEKLEIQSQQYKRLLEMSDIKAPSPGVVVHTETHRSGGSIGKAKVGDEIYARVPFMQIAEITNLQVHTEVSEMDVKFLKPGNKVRVLLKGNSISAFPGWVSSIAYVAQTEFKKRQDAVVKVVVDLTSPEKGIDKVAPEFRPGQSCEVEFPLYNLEQALYVPFDAVLPTENGPCVVRAADNEIIPVKVGFSDGLNGYVLESGVSEGDEILLMEAP